MVGGGAIGRLPAAGQLCLILLAAAAPAARADVFNGRIAFSSDRADPPAGVARAFDIFSMNADGGDVRRLTTNPELDRQSDWSPDGRDLAYSIRKPGATINFEVARMTAAGTGHTRLTTTPDGQASSQPAWRPDGKGILFRRSGPGLQFARSGRWVCWGSYRRCASRRRTTRCIRAGRPT